jgi:hypothetical protein
MQRKRTPSGSRKALRIGGRGATPRPFRKVTPVPARRDKRYVVGLPVTLFVGRRWIEAETGDVSQGGVFVLLEEELHDGPVSVRAGPAGADPTDGLLRSGSLVRVEIALPPEGDPFGGTGRLVHQEAALARDGRRGVGVQFYGLGREAQERWASFVSHVRTNYPSTEERLVTVATARQVDAAYLRTAGQVGTLRVEVESVRALVTMLSRDLGRSSIFLACSAEAFVDDELLVQIVHPLSEDVFELTGRVRRVVKDGGVRGLDLELLRCDDERRKRFEEFVYDAMAPMFDDEEVVPEE